MKRLFGLALAVGILAMLGGCIYDPAYYHRPAVVYDDGTAPAGAYYDYGDYYAPGYYYGPAYSPWYGYGGWYPWVGVGFYGSYYHGSHGHYGHGGWHGHNGGGWHGHGGGGHGGSHH